MTSVTTPCIRCRKPNTRAAVAARFTMCSDCMTEVADRKCACGIPISWCMRVCGDCSIRRYLQSRYLSGGVLAQTEVAKARRRGVLPAPRAYPCSDCGTQATEYDHRDYNAPLVVQPVCRDCNARRGRAAPRQWAPGEWAAYVERCVSGSRARLGNQRIQEALRALVSQQPDRPAPKPSRSKAPA